MAELLITNIQRFSLHDGPGIRTTVFLKGCGVRCPWCCNPENLESRVQPYVKDGHNGTYGRFYTTSELIDEIMRDAAFYRGSLPRGEWRISDANQLDALPGGVTFSGGEALLQAETLAPVMQELGERGLHVAMETCLFVPRPRLDVVAELVNLFYVDLKVPNQQRCAELLGGDADLHRQNLDSLLRAGVPVVVRVPVIGGFTDSEANRAQVLEFLSDRASRILKVELIKGHNLGEPKYRSLGLEPPAYREVTDPFMDSYANDVVNLGIPVEVCRI